MIKRVCVYCASSAKIDPKYFIETEKLAQDFVKNGIHVVYGGGALGLMGQLADTIIAEGGKVSGVLPHFMREVEWGHEGVTDMQFTETMHERKAKLLEGVDALVALPGGSGTWEELFEAFTLKKLGQFTKPIIVLNTDKYYRPFQEMISLSIEEKFMRKEHGDIMQFVDYSHEVIPAMQNAPIWSHAAIDFAVVK